MAIQYSDTHFSEIMPFDEALTRFNECVQNGTPVQALHVGTPAELHRRMQKATLEQQLAEVQGRVEAIEAGMRLPKSEFIRYPTEDELLKFKKAP